MFDPEATEDEKQAAREAVKRKLDLATRAFKGPFVLGAEPTVADDYLFVMLTWAENLNIATPEPLAAFAARMRERPAVRLALKHEGFA